MDLSQISAHIKGRFALDAKLRLLPVLAQIVEGDATDAVLQAAADDYTRAMEEALASPGVAAVVIAAEGDTVSDKDSGALDLWNLVVIAIQENAKTNTTGLTAYGHMRRALRVIHAANTQEWGARVETKLSKPAWSLGPLGGGKTVYFINALVRTTEPLGAVEPVTA